MVEPTQVLGALGGAAKALGPLLQLLKGKDDAAIRAAVADIQEKLLEAQTQGMELVRMLAGAEDRNRRLEGELRQLREVGEFVWKENVYWTPDGDGPFCPKCRDGDEKKVRLQDDDSRWWSCPVCAGTHDKPERIASTRRALENLHRNQSGWSNDDY